MIRPFYIWLKMEKGIDCFQQDIKVPWRYHEEWFALQEEDAIKNLNKKIELKCEKCSFISEWNPCNKCCMKLEGL